MGKKFTDSKLKVEAQDDGCADITKLLQEIPLCQNLLYFPALWFCIITHIAVSTALVVTITGQKKSKQ